MSLMSGVLCALKGTPFWVWFLLLYIVYVGIKATHSKVVYLPKIFILPSILIFLKLLIFSLDNFIIFAFFLFVGAIFGFSIHRNLNVVVIEGEHLIKLPGDKTKLCGLLAFFTMKYAFGCLESFNLHLYCQYLILDTVFSGIFSGYFLGHALRCLYKYKQSI